MLIGARQGFWNQGGGKPTAKSYVQDGLILQLDGIENAGYGKHDPKAKSWKSLTKGNELIFDGNVVVDHNSMRFNEAGEKSVAFGNIAIKGAERTIETVFEQSLLNGFQWFVSPLNIPTVYNTGGKVAINAPGGFDKYLGVYLSQGSRSDVVKDGVGWDFFCNGIFNKFVISNNIHITSYSGEVCIGNNRAKTRGVIGKIHSVRIYDRALTPEEIASNYAIDKERFGL